MGVPPAASTARAYAESMYWYSRPAFQRPPSSRQGGMPMSGGMARSIPSGLVVLARARRLACGLYALVPGK